ncbi:hypothetical protein FRX31_007395 [Thalictrum thalictroides]|uniref:Uncharacterized protein n=1 Tax=Thalictrum thalictroides TaxID=46969 RepID=A0A7J6WZX2_THATH|nr:hypothetical protein FRX31_007395 [Thalictrum thalictroides]
MPGTCVDRQQFLPEMGIEKADPVSIDGAGDGAIWISCAATANSTDNIAMTKMMIMSALLEMLLTWAIENKMDRTSLLFVARTDRAIDEQRTAPEIGNEKADPVTIDGAGDGAEPHGL